MPSGQGAYRKSPALREVLVRMAGLRRSVLLRLPARPPLTSQVTTCVGVLGLPFSKSLDR